ncbi:dienelactone hydrolase family protein [Bradyrhizobium manausense]|uniref:alpha/beta hydrolase family protein n=1 Tax=Bradyrhizobium TaxID=374 RepID=UPI001BA810CF|nr:MULTISPECIES: dienelactone hydrolase family protein [Bradyrhizobium]MBR0827021.1 dienelactone hydrolase family protein [Bradyrhizobium manausense]UVO32299.1 dienelactone hydrolase family protein [Bradyrhizobium arachidis]
MRFGLSLGLGLVLLATCAHAAGLRSVEVTAEGDRPTLNVLIWSPCAAPPDNIRLGPFTLPAVRDCPVAGSKLPLIVVSHGFGGNNLGHHDTAEALADAGFVVAALNHPGDTTAANSANTLSPTALGERPADVKRLIDFMLGASPVAASIDPERVGFFGFSRGGYTGIVIAGGNPDFTRGTASCGGDARCAKLAALGGLTHDPRVKAVVIADPLSFFDAPKSVEDIKVPIQLWSSQFGGGGVLPESVATVAHNLNLTSEFHLVPNSGHFVFLAPCPAAMAARVPDICTDPPGFDRVAFHERLDAEIVAFFRKHFGM